MPGKKVLEILPPLNWNKGKILKLLLAILHPNIKNIIPIYIGDDATDEHAFKILKKSGITIAVGKIRNTQAKYYVKNTREVLMLLGKILKLKTKQTH